MKTYTQYQQIPNAETPKDWIYTSVGSVVSTISQTFDFSKVDELVFLNTSDVLEGKVLLHDRVTKNGLPGQAKKSIQKGDILFSEIRPKNKRYAYIDFDAQDYVVSTKLMVLRTNGKISPRYFLHFITSNKILNELQVLAESRSGTFPQITFSEVANLDIFLPSRIEQDEIATFIDDLDKKIDLNRKMNKTLEEMGKALFKRWFVDFEFPDENGKPYKSIGGVVVESELGFIPKGWEAKKISEIKLEVNDFVANGSFASLKENTSVLDAPDYALFLRNTDLKDDFASGFKYVDQHAYEFLSKTKLFGGEVIISNVGDVGSVYRCPHFQKPMTLGNNQIVIKAKEYNLFFYLLFISPIGKGLINSITTGSVQLKFNKTDFRNLRVIWPPADLLNRFLTLGERIFQLIDENKKNLKTLESLRDSLLPRLMSGKLRV